MSMKRVVAGISVGLFLVVSLIGCGSGRMATSNSSANPVPNTPLYTKYNIHVQDQVRRNGDHVYQASYANYTNPGTGHVILPVGSKIEVTRASGREFSFNVPEKGYNVQFEYHEARMGMSVNDYIEKITSPAPVSLKGFSDLDRKGISQGKALVGMSRDGVVAALGYPAAHRTPSLDAPTYVYWTNRFGTLAVHFDQKGKVQKVQN